MSANNVAGFTSKNPAFSNNGNNQYLFMIRDNPQAKTEAIDNETITVENFRLLRYAIDGKITNI